MSSRDMNPSGFDPASASVQADPYPFYPALRSMKPVLKAELRGQPCWIVSRRADIAKILMDPHSFSSRNAPMPDMLNSDPPDHERLRKIVAPMFTRTAVQPLSDVISARAKGLCATIVRNGRCDIINDLASPLTIHVIAHLLGIAVGELEDIRQWSKGIADFVIALRVGQQPEPAAQAAMADMTAFMMGIVERRTYIPGGVIAVLAGHWRDGELSDEELVHFAILLFIAGHSTTTNLIGNAIYVLAQRPADLARIRNDPDFTAPFIEEVLRTRPSFQRIQRVTTREVQLHDEIIPKGSIIRLLLGSANRDPEFFSAPEEFAPDSKRRMHSAFGQGIHSCLGSWLARLEAGLAIDIFAKSVAALSLDPEDAPTPFTGGTFNEFGFYALPVIMKE